MYSWILIAVVTGVIVAVFLVLLCIMLSLSTKSWINNGRPTAESAKNEQNGQNVVVTDPYSGKLMNLERVSNAGSLRSTKSIGFIAYDNTDSSSHGRGRTTPLFHTGSIRSVRSNKSATSSIGSMNQELKNVNVNPVFKEDNVPDQLWLGNSSQMRARGLVFE